MHLPPVEKKRLEDSKVIKRYKRVIITIKPNQTIPVLEKQVLN
jgi:ribosomal protein L36